MDSFNYLGHSFNFNFHKCKKDLSELATKALFSLLIVDATHFIYLLTFSENRLTTRYSTSDVCGSEGCNGGLEIMTLLKKCS